MTIARVAGAIASAAALTAMTADRPAGFSFDPQPRWSEEAETEQVCEAMASECAGLLRDGSIETDWAYAELYDADGYLVGLRSLKSTGCKPLDEHMLQSQRRFRLAFSEPGQSDLEGIAIETAAGLDRNGVRLVKTGETSVSFGC